MKRIQILICLPILLTSAIAVAQDDNATPDERTIDLQKVDRDYAFQGEYVGEREGTKQGVQIIAVGNGKFKATAYYGGLPGDGFDGEGIQHFEGKREGEKVTIAPGGVGTSVIENGAMTVAGGDGKVVVTFAKVDRESPTLGMEPPEGAIVLFDGQNVDQWKPGKISDDGLLMQGARSKKKFQDHQLHVEFLLPYCPHKTGQARGNSGIYLQGRYEVQMLDSFGLESKDNDCGGIYKTATPVVNMCFPPLRWQTYDIDFTAGTYDKDGKQTAKPRITVKHNGVMIHDDVELPKRTTASPLKDGPAPGPVFLQNHKNPVRYRNIWVVEK